MADHPIVARLISQLEGRGYGAKSRDVAVESLTNNGILDHRGDLTALGRQRQAMGAEGRAKDRAAKASDGVHKAADYRYDAGTNKATVKPSRRAR